MITYAIGDIHGCREELVQLIRLCQDYHAEKHHGEEMRYVFVGDYIDRGPDSKGVIDFLIRLEGTGVECVFLMGNHEDMFMNDIGLCMMNGGYQTMMSYGWNSYQGSPEAWAKDNFPKEHWDFLKGLKLWYRDGLRTYVHAGIDRHYDSMTQQNKSVMLWTRFEFLHDESENGGYVVHGHTPIGPELKPNRCNLDSSCVFGGYLTAAVFDEKQAEPISMLASDVHVKETMGPL